MYAAIRVRGSVNIAPAVRKTLRLLGLHRVNHMALVRDEQRGMLEKVRAYITFGEVDEKTLALALERKGRLQGDKKLDAKFFQEMKFKGFEAAAKALVEKKTTLHKLGIKNVFRLRPPRKGYERAGIKKAYSAGGALGYRAADINRLVLRML